MRNPYPKFVWFFGIAEDTSSDPLRLGRVRVRAVGFHPSLIKSKDLPWAPVLDGGAARITKGQMVLGFFMDGEQAQQPCVLGTISGAVTGSTIFDFMRRLGDAIKDFLPLVGKDDPEVLQDGQNNPVAPNSTGFMNPLGNANYRLSTDFGPRPRPRAGASTNHKGVDLATSPKDTVKIFAAKSGTVILAGFLDSYGNVVYIDHGDGVQTRYAHMRYSPDVKTGQTVKQGDNLGVVGSTGISTGDHLHYEIRQGNSSSTVNEATKPIDPAPYLAKKG